MILPSGISKLDRVLGRGITTGLITHIFGRAGVGKTTFALSFVKSVLDLGDRVIYINSETTSPVERLEQIMSRKYEEYANQITLLLPKNFEEQNTIIEDLDLYVKDDT
ncbi:MAG: ATPase domain-containing protein, partial [Candidatus Thorarchaeota archaeon]